MRKAVLVAAVLAALAVLGGCNLPQYQWRNARTGVSMVGYGNPGYDRCDFLKDDIRQRCSDNCDGQCAFIKNDDDRSECYSRCRSRCWGQAENNFDVRNCYDRANAEWQRGPCVQNCGN